MAKKQQDKFLAALLKIGEIEIKRLTGCIVISRKEGGYYYLGSSGSVRFGSNRQGSVPISSKLKQSLLQVV